MRLYEQGRLSLDDPMVKYVPEANNQGKDKITLRNLLLHNSGYPADYPFPEDYMTVTRDMILNWMYSTALEYPTGTKTIYSDVSMLAL